MTLLQRATGALILTLIGAPALFAWNYTSAQSHENVAAAIDMDIPPQEERHTTAEVPAFVIIPRIKVSAASEQVGLTDKNHMENPSEWDSVGWYRYGVRPGENGHAVIAGHLDSDTGPAVFWDLRDLQAGDEILIVDTHGARRTFTVSYLAEYDAHNVPMNQLFGPASEPRIVLITCDGSWQKNGYSKRLAVFARLTDEQSTYQSDL